MGLDAETLELVRQAEVRAHELVTNFEHETLESPGLMMALYSKEEAS